MATPDQYRRLHDLAVSREQELSKLRQAIEEAMAVAESGDHEKCFDMLHAALSANLERG